MASTSLLSNVATHIFQLIVIYYAIGRQKLVVRHRVEIMRVGEAVLSNVLIEKSVLMKLSVQNLNNLNRCAFVNQVSF